jgi:hypothetical protein
MESVHGKKLTLRKETVEIVQSQENMTIATIARERLKQAPGENMFPLNGSTYPTSANELTRRIQETLAEIFAFANAAKVVKVESAAWPTIERLTLDLSGTRVKVSQPPPKPEPEGAREPGVRINQLNVTGNGIQYQQSKFDLTVAAQQVTTDFSHDSQGRTLIMLKDAADGFFEIKITKAALQSAMLSAANEAAATQGVSVQDLQINLASDGARSLAVEVRVKAKKMMMSGVITVRGKADIDQNLVATLSNLSCTGEGVIGGMAAAMVNTKLRLFEGKQFPLTAFSLEDVTVRDLRVTTSDPVVLRTEFGRRQ